ncbi:hypothetical protein A1353_14085 [Methylomonas methanica]|uniref:DUF1173 family protein n=1 Tax=Methylomonas methanica TaxID=421 RepID=A0A177MEV4_METMH|nr:DUF1173 family protein [Methylomonas methanica]OAI03865.1 hypothetical protein A1353_14085 [Methylomonas methanica]
MSELLLDGEAYDYLWLTDRSNPKAQQILRRYHGCAERPCCQCLTDTRNRQLVIKIRGQRYYLARKAYTSHHHAEWCLLYEPSETGSSSVKQKPAIQCEGDTVNVKLQTRLTRASFTTKQTDDNPVAEDNPNPPHNKAPSLKPGRASTRLVGLFHALIQKAQLNLWQPQQTERQFAASTRALVKAAQTVTLEKQQPVAERLVITLREKNLEHSQAINLAALQKKTANPQQAAIVVGEIKECWKNTKVEGALGLKLKLLNVPLWLPPPVARKATNSFGQLFGEIGKPDRRILVIAAVFRSKTSFVVSDIGLIRTNRQFIPVDSSYELQVADNLIAERRAFSKPLKLEGELRYLLDFMLQDCQVPWVMEVFGITNDDKYQAQKLEKLQYYRDHGIPCWQWEPDTEKVMPDFPIRT